MNLSRTDETELLIPLHQGVHEQPRWTTFLRRLRQRTRADYAGLILRHRDAPSSEAMEFFSGRDFRGEATRLGGRELRQGRVYDSDEVAWLRGDRTGRSGPHHGRIVRVDEPGGVDAWAIVSRDARDFSGADSALLASLAPHLAVAVRTFAASIRDDIRVRASDDALGRAGIGWATLDAEARIVTLSPVAEPLLARATGRSRLIGERLQPSSAEAARSVAHASAALAADPRATPQALLLSETPRIELLLCPIREPLPAALAAAVAIALVRAQPAAEADAAPFVATLFGLSAGEARLAASLARGRSIAEAAGLLGLTVETARNYSKRIYAKTGARGQTELVRMILSGVAPLA